jgi:hypothetical protein
MTSRFGILFAFKVSTAHIVSRQLRFFRRTGPDGTMQDAQTCTSKLGSESSSPSLNGRMPYDMANVFSTGLGHIESVGPNAWLVNCSSGSDCCCFEC